MSLKDYKFPLRFHRGSLWVNDDNGCQFCEMLRHSDAAELCAILNAHFAKKEEPMEQVPTPNQAETDRVAMEFIKSGRKIIVQYWDASEWHDASGGDGSYCPSFNYFIPWRIKPQKRRVVVGIWKTQMGDVISRISDGNPYVAGCKLLGTIEGEVEV